MTKIAEVSPKQVARMVVYYDKAAARNPYRVYLEWLEPTAHGLAHRKQQQYRFADLASAVWEMWQYALKHDEEKR